jgi:2-keto-4-pentenoate hydratase/2-oxohepta-3-ene-1,7-dioic acid hydratase in catechol pathway
MKLVTFVKSGEERLGLLAGDAVIDPLLASGDKTIFASVLSFIKSGAAGMNAARAILANPPKQASLALKDVKLAAPHHPATVLCSGSNYKDHNAEKANTPISGKEPEFFVKTADCVVGPDEPIALRSSSASLGASSRPRARWSTCSATPSSTTSPHATARSAARPKA